MAHGREGDAVHYGGRRHIERLTDLLTALGDDDESAERGREQQETLEALHAALLCRTRPVRCPPDFVTHHETRADWRAALPVGRN